MSECKDCQQIRALQNTFEGFANNAKDQLARLNKESGDYEKRISSLESGSAVSEERFKQVFEKLDTIIETLRDRQQRIPNLVYAVVGTAAGGSIGGVVVWIVTRGI